MTWRCEWCGEHGHDYTVHAEAVAEAEAWRADDEPRQELSGWFVED